MDSDPDGPRIPKMESVRPGQLAVAAAELFLGASCAGCGASGWTPCAACLASLRTCVPLVPPTTLDVPVVAAGEYDGVAKVLLLAAKERGALALLPLLGQRLAVAVAALLVLADAAGPVVLVPVPSPRGRVADRGLDLTGSLARAAARELTRSGLTVGVRRTLRLRRRPADQSELGVLARQRNLAGAFVCAGPPPAGQIVVVDDIVTTGASITEAVRAIRQAGGSPLGAATVAATMRWGDAR